MKFPPPRGLRCFIYSLVVLTSLSLIFHLRSRTFSPALPLFLFRFSHCPWDYLICVLPASKVTIILSKVSSKKKFHTTTCSHTTGLGYFQANNRTERGVRIFALQSTMWALCSPHSSDNRASFGGKLQITSASGYNWIRCSITDLSGLLPQSHMNVWASVFCPFLGMPLAKAAVKEFPPEFNSKAKQLEIWISTLMDKFLLLLSSRSGTPVHQEYFTFWKYWLWSY